jgi:hypothetical protein
VFQSESAVDASIGASLFSDIRTVFDTRKPISIHSKDLVVQLCEMDGMPWPEWNNGKALSPASMAKLLKPFHVHSKDMRIGALPVAKGYERSSFEDPWARYCSRSMPFPDAATATALQPSSLLNDALISKRNTITAVAVAKVDPDSHESSPVAPVAVESGSAIQPNLFEPSPLEDPESAEDEEMVGGYE